MFAKLLLIASSLSLASAGAAHAWPGKLAVVSGGRLVLLAPSGRHVVNGPGAPSDPAWSPDGRWVAFLRGGEALWAASSTGADAHRVSPAGSSVSAFHWVPGGSGETLAFSANRPSAESSTVFLASASSTALHALGTYRNFLGFSVAPSGKQLAVSYRAGLPPTGSSPPRWKGVLRVVPLAGGPGRVVYTLPQGGYVLLSPGWWPNGKGLLFWADPAGSASIAADGLPLDSLDLVNGKVSQLATTLTYLNWVAWSPAGTELAIVAGGDRILWDSGKHLVVCFMPAARCNPVPLLSPAAMALDPAWTPQGGLVYDVAPANRSPGALAPPGVKMPANQPFGKAAVTAWYSHMRLYEGVKPLGDVPEGAHDALPTPQGLFFLRGADLFWLATGAPHPVQVATGLTSPGYYGAGNYYGYIAWYEALAWHS
jgi:dipeptidyl aminopeptidase/acylaminoacyl peptidase